MADARLRILVGPTAAGKSALVMALAAEVPIAILSADSRQIYRGFDVGTAKPGRADRDAVPHFGLDVAEPGERYSAARWAAAARDWIRQAHALGRDPVVVGGTGFYIRALTAPLFDAPPLDEKARRDLQRHLATHSTETLRRWCLQLDRPRAHLGRAQLLRAIEVALLTGVPISTWHRRAGRASGVQARYLVVDPGATLHRRIANRVEAMLAAGWEAEVRALLHLVDDNAPAWNATGYRSIRELVRGTLRRTEAVEQITIHTRQYAKRQRTWFRHQLPGDDVTLLDPMHPDAHTRLLRWWNADRGSRP
ncbi:MAG TPA: tRNA (adenosine(37)-N6)-dimethylallyltransferase MiaA [Gemmatimonadaceae bacterium]